MKQFYQITQWIKYLYRLLFDQESSIRKVSEGGCRKIYNIFKQMV